MKVTVLGLGKIGHSIAGLLSSRGAEVTGYTRDPERAEAANRYGITVGGALNGNFKVHVTTDPAEAVRGADYLFVTTLASGHKPLAETLKGLLEPGQRIVIITGNWGAYEMYSVLRDEVREKGIIIGETSGNLAAVPAYTGPATVEMHVSKKKMSFATIPAYAAPQITEELKTLMPEFYPVSNILETSLNNTNPPVHVPICLFNITRLANGEQTAFYGEALPKFLLDFLNAADAERCAVAEALGTRPQSITDLMNSVWEVQYGNIKELGLNNPSLSKVNLPLTPYHRFLTEDVPYGFMPVSRLGKEYGVPTPRIDLQIEAFRYLFGDDKGPAEITGPELKKELIEEAIS